ncbi:hypothetical protein Xmau_03462 [Xenorhabdus mauleonii]|uniref:Uncharacterized protein n=1 Tax=Xenorhabdus mauleonii TaxID=351675 RepID=A0A1I3VRB1_9GAMM|nr:hypothetical protein Xmau_03462 [Xenorhabdus mauleonii]SFJ97700.1 hypothetical protein SAMN05421680_12229 [Xenorhabdus mauleonii]
MLLQKKFTLDKQKKFELDQKITESLTEIMEEAKVKFIQVNNAPGSVRSYPKLAISPTPNGTDFIIPNSSEKENIINICNNYFQELCKDIKSKSSSWKCNIM